MSSIYGSTINGIVSTGNQIIRLTTTNGQIKITLKYYSASQIWVMDLNFNDITINGIRLALSYNIIRAWRNILGFGIMVDSVDGIDPMYIDDFSSGKKTLLLLSQDEVNTIESFYCCED